MANNPNFPTTSWTLLSQAVRGGEGPEAEMAMEYLCARYWYPLYAFARWKGFRHEEAQDQTQSFLARLVHRRLLASADASRGRLRTFLLAAFQRHLTNAWEHDRAARRGGNAETLPLEMGSAEQRFALEIADPGRTPEENFDKAWANAVLDACLAGMEARYEEHGRGGEFAQLRPFLSPAAVASANITDAASRLGLNEAAIRQRVSRMRADFAHFLREHVGGSLADPTPEAIDDELRSLKLALQR